MRRAGALPDPRTAASRRSTCEGGAFWDPEADAALFDALDRAPCLDRDRRARPRCRSTSTTRLSPTRGRRFHRNAKALRDPLMPAIARNRPSSKSSSTMVAGRRADRRRRRRHRPLRQVPRRRAASTSSSSTIPAATAWPAAARPPGLLAYGNANEIVNEMAREVLPVVEAHAGARRRQRHRPVRADAACFLAELKATGLFRRAELSDHRPRSTAPCARASKRPAWAMGSRST